MGIPYAEVIGDPVAHSLSPAIHKYWLERLAMEGDYRATRCKAGDLTDYLERRCADPFWRGSNVTAPLKAEAARLAVDPTGLCTRIGAANAIFRSPLGCGVGANTDVIGIAAAIGAAAPKSACIVGAGGAARAALEVLRVRGTTDIRLLARDSRKACRLGAAYAFDDARAAAAGADCVINATPLGMTRGPEMPEALLAALDRTAEDALVLDMVYAPLETALLGRARSLGRRTVDGLTMLIGQARPAFALFFGVPAPPDADGELRGRLAS
jgi:shikimate dehydrogenase